MDVYCCKTRAGSLTLSSGIYHKRISNKTFSARVQSYERSRTPLEAEYGSARARAPRFNLKSISRALRAARAARVTLRRTINFT